MTILQFISATTQEGHFESTQTAMNILPKYYLYLQNRHVYYRKILTVNLSVLKKVKCRKKRKLSSIMER